MLWWVNLDTGVDPTKKAMRIGDLEVNLEARTVSRQGVPLVLRQKEYDLLILLMNNLGKVVTRGEIFDQIWGTDWLAGRRIIVMDGALLAKTDGSTLTTSGLIACVGSATASA